MLNNNMAMGSPGKKKEADGHSPSDLVQNEGDCHATMQGGDYLSEDVAKPHAGQNFVHVKQTNPVVSMIEVSIDDDDSESTRFDCPSPKYACPGRELNVANNLSLNLAWVPGNRAILSLYGFEAGSMSAFRTSQEKWILPPQGPRLP
jgi:hypothetical protein